MDRLSRSFVTPLVACGLMLLTASSAAGRPGPKCHPARPTRPGRPAAQGDRIQLGRSPDERGGLGQLPAERRGRLGDRADPKGRRWAVPPGAYGSARDPGIGPARLGRPATSRAGRRRMGLRRDARARLAAAETPPAERGPCPTSVGRTPEPRTRCRARPRSRPRTPRAGWARPASRRAPIDRPRPPGRPLGRPARPGGRQAGGPAHPGPARRGEVTLEALVRRHLRPDDPASVYLGTVHRLDRPVSGVVLWAKTPKAARRWADAVRGEVGPQGILGDRRVGRDGPRDRDRGTIWDDWLSPPDAQGRARVGRAGAPFGP